MKNFKYYIIALSACLLMQISFAANWSNQQNKLESINSQISNLKQNIDRAQNRHDLLENDLKKTEIHIGQLYAELNDLNKNIKQQQRIIHQLNQQQQSFNQSLLQQQRLLAEQIRTSYIIGRQDYLKMILNQENPAEMGRSLVYFKYFDQARVDLIQSLNKTIGELAINKNNIKQQTDKLIALANNKNDKFKQLKQRNQRRNQILSRIQQQIHTKTQSLNNLTKNKNRLLNIITSLQQQEQTNPVTPPPLAFAKLKGKIPWPTKGRITNHYGKTIDSSSLKYTGVLIQAPEGQNIYAIYPGKVVFSGWLKGFGLLIIVDHGSGYMSLYGHNQSLYQKVGTIVNAGDLIAKVGNSGGFKQSGLYFEIRRNGKPLNPERWCTNKKRSTWLA